MEAGRGARRLGVPRVDGEEDHLVLALGVGAARRLLRRRRRVWVMAYLRWGPRKSNNATKCGLVEGDADDAVKAEVGLDQPVELMLADRVLHVLVRLLHGFEVLAAAVDRREACRFHLQPHAELRDVAGAFEAAEIVPIWKPLGLSVAATKAPTPSRLDEVVGLEAGDRLADRERLTPKTELSSCSTVIILPEPDELGTIKTKNMRRQAGGSI